MTEYRFSYFPNKIKPDSQKIAAKFAELERDLISLRTKKSVAAKKARGQILGKPKGSIQKSKFDKDVDRIKELLGYRLAVRKIAKVPEHSILISTNAVYTSKSRFDVWPKASRSQQRQNVRGVRS